MCLVWLKGPPSTVLSAGSWWQGPQFSAFSPRWQTAQAANPVFWRIAPACCRKPGGWGIAIPPWQSAQSSGFKVVFPWSERGVWQLVHCSTACAWTPWGKAFPWKFMVFVGGWRWQRRHSLSRISFASGTLDTATSTPNCLPTVWAVACASAKSARAKPILWTPCPVFTSSNFPKAAAKALSPLLLISICLLTMANACSVSAMRSDSNCRHSCKMAP